MAIMCVVNGIVVSFAHALIGFVMVVFMFPVLSRMLIPRWIESICRCDVPSVSYMSEVYIYHLYCNPIARGFAKMLTEKKVVCQNYSKRIWGVYAKLNGG